MTLPLHTLLFDNRPVPPLGINTDHENWDFTTATGELLFHQVAACRRSPKALTLKVTASPSRKGGDPRNQDVLK
jgi:hypothetical protein